MAPRLHGDTLAAERAPPRSRIRPAPRARHGHGDDPARRGSRPLRTPAALRRRARPALWMEHARSDARGGGAGCLGGRTPRRRRRGRACGRLQRDRRERRARSRPSHEGGHGRATQPLRRGAGSARGPHRSASQEGGAARLGLPGGRHLPRAGGRLVPLPDALRPQRHAGLLDAPRGRPRRHRRGRSPRVCLARSGRVGAALRRGARVRVRCALRGDVRGLPRRAPALGRRLRGRRPGRARPRDRAHASERPRDGRALPPPRSRSEGRRRGPRARRGPVRAREHARVGARPAGGRLRVAAAARHGAELLAARGVVRRGGRARCGGARRGGAGRGSAPLDTLSCRHRSRGRPALHRCCWRSQRD